MSKQRILLFSVLAIVPVLLAMWLAGFDVSYQLGNYVVTDNAFVAGEVHQASAPAAGQVTELLLEVGDSVEKGQNLANLSMPVPAPAIPSPRINTGIRSPAPGTILHLNVVRGQSVTLGQTIASIADLSRLWVIANVDETAFKDIRPGMPVQIYLNALDRYFNGTVNSLLPDLPSGLVAAGRASGPNVARPVAQLPVRIDFSYGDALVYPGMTANIKIFIR